MIVFENPGKLDLRLLLNMGTSVKEEDAIGTFGTGLKFALAVLLREKQQVTLSIGTESYAISTIEQEIRGKSFEILHLSGFAPEYHEPSLGITTKLGKNWKLWHAFRELWSNCMDEGGRVYQSGKEQPKYEDHTTTFTVVGAEFEKIWEEREDFLLFPSAIPLFQTPEVQVFSQAKSRVYYKGIQVAENTGLTASFSYNLLGKVQLTEDRTIADPLRADRTIGTAWLSCQNIGLIESFLDGDGFEQNLSFPSMAEISEEFLTVVRRRIRKKEPLSWTVRSYFDSVKPELVKRALELGEGPQGGLSWESLQEEAPRLPDRFSDSAVYNELGKLTDALEGARASAKFWQRACEMLLAVEAASQEPSATAQHQPLAPPPVPDSTDDIPF